MAGGRAYASRPKLPKAEGTRVARTEAPPVVHEVLRSPGQPLDELSRSELEPLFGHEFSRVRVHHDRAADASARAVGALAFTLGRHIAFREGHFAPRSLAGKGLLAHELAHVVQQSTRAAPLLQRRSDPDADPLHEPIIDDYRRRHGLSAQGPFSDAGPSDGDIKYRLGIPARLGGLFAMTPWELSRAAPGAVAAPPGPPFDAAGPNFSDYERARRVAIETFTAVGPQTDPDQSTGPVGRSPTPPEAAIVDAQVQRLVALPGVPPPSPGRMSSTGSPSIRQNVRITADIRQFRLKQYEHDRWLADRAGLNDAVVLANLASAWRNAGYAQDSRLTPQERRLSLWLQPPAAAFYNPVDDTIYLGPNVNLQSPGDLEIVRHEAAHFLGGRGATFQAFEDRLRPTIGSGWLDYFVGFEEGIAEMLALDSAPPGQSQAQPTTASTTTTSSGSTTTVTVTSTGAYTAQVAWIRGIANASAQNRALLLRAYFSGQVPEGVFQLLLDRNRFGSPPHR